MKPTQAHSGHSPTTLLTGYRGLASSFIEVFSKNNHRLSVLVRDPAAIASLEGQYPSAFFFSGDVRNPGQISEWLSETYHRFGRVDCLINNAAVSGPGGLFHDLKFSDFRESLDINLLAPAELCHRVLPYMIQSNSGVIINLSGGGATFARPRFLAYAVAKCAILRLTETLAEEYPQLGIYAIAPGSLMTPMMEKVAKLSREKIGKEWDEAQRRIQEGGDDPLKAAELALWLFNQRPPELSGKLISAKWDKYQEHANHPKNVGYWNLRRVDEVLIRELKKHPEFLSSL